MSQRAFITGSTRGIGRAIARAILLANGRVTVTGRDRAGVDAAVEALQVEAGGTGRVAGQVLDVRDPVSVERAVSAAAAAFGGLDVVVNNAGVGIYGGLETVSDADWRLVMDTNVAGPFHVMRASIPRLREAGGGWIINIASLAGASPFADGGVYCASKAALLALSESAMQELRGDNIRVSVVLPGSTATGFSGRGGGDESWRLLPDDVAEVVVDLLRHPARSLPSRVEISALAAEEGISVQIEAVSVPPFYKNGYVVACEETGEAVLIDPGDEVEDLLKIVRATATDVKAILLTHAHLDHITGVGRAKAELNVPIWLHREDVFLYDGIVEQAGMFGMDAQRQPPVDCFYELGMPFRFGRYVAEALHTPGHCPGGVCLAIGRADDEGRELFVGDTLFAGAIGRTDLPGGDHDRLVRAIIDVLMRFPDDTVVHPGHGPDTTIGRERKTNPFLV